MVLFEGLEEITHSLVLFLDIIDGAGVTEALLPVQVFKSCEGQVEKAKTPLQ